MKKFILSALVVVMMAGSADAQAYRLNKSQKQQKQQMKAINRQAKQQPVQMKSQLYSQLNMNTYQRSQADRLNQNFGSRLKLLGSNNNLTIQQKRSAANSLVQQHQSGFRSMLSPAQSQQYGSLLNSGALQPAAATSGLGSMLGQYGWVLDLLGSNLNLGNLLGGNLDLGAILGLFTK